MENTPITRALLISTLFISTLGSLRAGTENSNILKCAIIGTFATAFVAQSYLKYFHKTPIKTPLNESTPEELRRSLIPVEARLRNSLLLGASSNPDMDPDTLGQLRNYCFFDISLFDLPGNTLLDQGFLDGCNAFDHNGYMGKFRDVRAKLIALSWKEPILHRLLTEDEQKELIETMIVSQKHLTQRCITRRYSIDFRVIYETPIEKLSLHGYAENFLYPHITQFQETYLAKNVQEYYKRIGFNQAYLLKKYQEAVEIVFEEAHTEVHKIITQKMQANPKNMALLESTLATWQDPYQNKKIVSQRFLALNPKYKRNILRIWADRNLSEKTSITERHEPRLLDEIQKFS